MLGLLWEWHQHERINDANRKASDLNASIRDRSSDVERLQQRVDALVLANLAMWTILRDKLNVTDADLERRVQEIDLSDGELDGKVRVGPWNCTACKRPNAPRHAKCLYCGIERAGTSVFPV
ncbi:hypothetical protein LBMAG48_08650 [Phycisphaerae bacterium]|nr:hypothetical protein LBMAG48_08650 [Phycisphaerae bacterium]